MSTQMDSIQILAGHPLLTPVFDRILNRANESIDWDSVDYPALDEPQRLGLSWAYAVWKDVAPPEEWTDPFDAFHRVSLDLRSAVLRSFATRHGFTHFEIDADEPLHSSGTEEARESALHRIAEHSKAMAYVGPFVDRKVPIEKWSSRGWSGGQKALLSWAYSIRKAHCPPKEGWRDPFEGFSIMDSDMKAFVLKVFAEANGFFCFEARRTKSEMEKLLKTLYPKN